MATKNVKTVNIVTDEKNPIPVELIAENIKKVADYFGKALSGGLTTKAICVLIQNSMPSKDKLSITEIQNVLIWASNLKQYIKK